MMASPTPADSGLFQFDQPSMTVTVQADMIYANGSYISGQYTVEVRVKSDDPADPGQA